MLKNCEEKFSERNVSIFLTIGNRKKCVSEVIHLSYFFLCALPNFLIAPTPSVVTCSFIKNKYPCINIFSLNYHKKQSFGLSKNVLSISRCMELEMLPFLKKTAIAMMTNLTLDIHTYVSIK